MVYSICLYYMGIWYMVYGCVCVSWVCVWKYSSNANFCMVSYWISELSVWLYALGGSVCFSIRAADIGHVFKSVAQNKY